MSYPPIALLTDFGEKDPFVGIMKGVIARIAPQSPLIDITHQVPPCDIQRGAITLWQAYPHFPEGTVFLTVIDPGVGTDRKAIYVQTQQRVFIGPDNGVFSYISDQDPPAWELHNPAYQYLSRSRTFHGRDLFAPAAAHAALGVKGPAFGPPLSNLVRLPTPKLHQQGDTLQGEILTQDRFGNLLTSLGKFKPTYAGNIQFEAWLGSVPDFEMSLSEGSLILPTGDKLPLKSTFADLERGSCAALVGSSGLLEIVSNRASAAEVLALQRGDAVQLSLSPQGETFQSV
ncbi:MAG: SAM-dependent chlorinase/fluorinase [Anaerolineales bacterium]